MGEAGNTLLRGCATKEEILRGLRPEKRGPISQGIAEWLRRQGKMRFEGRKSRVLDRLCRRSRRWRTQLKFWYDFLCERDASGPRKGLQAPLIQLNLCAPSFGPDCGQRAVILKGGCHAHRSPTRSASAPRLSQSPPSKRPGKSPRENGSSCDDHCRAISGCTPLWFCQLAEAEGSCGIP